MGATGKRGTQWYIGQDCENSGPTADVCIGDLFLDLDGCRICEYVGGVTGWLDTGKELGCLDNEDIFGALKQIPKIGAGGTGPTGDCLASFTVFECADMFNYPLINLELLQLGDTQQMNKGMFSDIDELIALMTGCLWSHVAGPMGSHYFFYQTQIVGDPDDSKIIFRDDRGVVTQPVMTVDCFGSLEDCDTIKNGSQVLICKNGKFYFVDLDCIFGFEFIAKDAGACQVMVLNPTDVNDSITVGPANAGDGFLSVTCPDGTNVGGDCRGENAIDLQRIRQLPGEVASGPRSFLAGGQANRVAEEALDSAVVAGVSNRVLGGEGNLVLGGTDNSLGPTGDWSAILAGTSNTVATSSSDRNVIVGGRRHQIVGVCDESVILGGVNNFMENAGDCGIMGGFSNRIQGGSIHAGIVGGRQNLITYDTYNNETNTSAESVIVGGSNNQILGSDSCVVAGGEDNDISGFYANTTLYGSHECGIVAGDLNKINAGVDCFIGGGCNNQIYADVHDGDFRNGLRSSIIAGDNNIIQGGRNCFLGGGFDNRLEAVGLTAGHYLTTNCVILGGGDHLMEGGENNFIGGGSENKITYHYDSDQNFHESEQSAVVGGRYHNIEGAEDCLIGGGCNNLVDRSVSSLALGGKQSDVVNGVNCAVIAGEQHTISSDERMHGIYYASWNNVIVGGYESTISIDQNPSFIFNSSVLGGQECDIYHSGTTGGVMNNVMIINGRSNTVVIRDSQFARVERSSIISGRLNQISIANNPADSFSTGNDIRNSVVMGGNSNSIRSEGGQSCEFDNNAIMGGYQNLIRSDGATGAYLGNTIIAGGQNNQVFTNNAVDTSIDNNGIVAGHDNYINVNAVLNGKVEDCVILGGCYHSIYTLNEGEARSCAILGGTKHIIYGNFYADALNSAIVAGEYHAMRHDNSVIIGGTGMYSSSDNEITVGGTLRIRDVPDSGGSNSVLVWDDSSLVVQKVCNNFAIACDERVKKDIRVLDQEAIDLEKLEEIKLISYRKKKTSRVENPLKYGFSAQNLQKVVPWAIKTGGKIPGYDEPDLLKVDQVAMITYLTGVCQKQQKKIDALETRLKKHEEMFSELMGRKVD